jgi:F-type H+-transporting ATPase subunit b
MLLLALAEQSIQLFPDGTLFIHVALILLMIWVLNRTFFRPINRVLQSREAHKGGKGGEAEGLLADVNRKQSEYERAILEARSRGYELIEQERTAAVDARQKHLADAKAEAAAKLEKDKQELMDSAAAAREAIAAEAREMGSTIAASILKV